jgi:hypothetical protein
MQPLRFRQPLPEVWPGFPERRAELGAWVPPIPQPVYRHRGTNPRIEPLRRLRPQLQPPLRPRPPRLIPWHPLPPLQQLLQLLREYRLSLRLLGA